MKINILKNSGYGSNGISTSDGTRNAPLILPGLTTSLFDRLKTLLPAIRVTSPVNPGNLFTSKVPNVKLSAFKLFNIFIFCILFIYCF